MALHLGTTAERLAVEAQMASSYRMRTRAHLLDLNHSFLTDLTSEQTGGDVSVDAGQTVSRSLRLDTFDPDDLLGLESSKNGYTAPTLMVQAWRDIYVDALSRWVPIPVFCGPITKPSRSGWTLGIEAQDKGALASFETSSLTIRKGHNGAWAIRTALAHVGETRFRVSSTSKVIKRDYVIGPDTTPLQVAKQIASSLGWVSFYDAEGYFVARPRTSGSVFTFTTGNDGTLMSPVSTGYWDVDVVNRVIAEGAVVGGRKIAAIATLNRNHELSPENLARDGKSNSGLRIHRAPQMDNLTTRGEAGQWAEDELYRLSIQSRSVAFDSRPVWHLQEHDVYSVVDHIDGVYATARVSQMSIPLTCDGAQSNGYLSRPGARMKARVKTRATRVRRPKSRKKGKR